MAVVNVDQLRFERNRFSHNDLNQSRDNGNSLSAGVVGEIGEAEIGDDSVFSQYEAVQVGQPPDSPMSEVRGNEIFVKLQDGGNSDIADTAQWAISVRNKGELGGGPQGGITGWRTHRDQDNADARRRNGMNPQTPVIPDGRLLLLLAKDETTSLTVDLSQGNTVLDIPFLGGK